MDDCKAITAFILSNTSLRMAAKMPKDVGGLPHTAYYCI